MKHLYLFLLYWLIPNLVHAQPKIPLVFKNIQPKWLHYSYDPKLPRFLQLHEQEGKPLVIGNNIYLLHNIFNNEDEGYLVENLDAETGQAKWSDSYYATEYNTRRYAAPLTKKGDKIEMYYFQEWKNEKPILFSWHSSRFRRIDYCADTGEKCDSLITDLNDSLNTNVIKPFTRVLPYTRRSLIFTNHNKVRYYRYEALYNNTTKQNYIPFKTLLLDSLGHKIDSNFVQINTKYQVWNIDFKQYEEGKYVCLIHTGKSESASPPKEVQLVYFDENLKIEKIVDLSSFMSKSITSSIAYIDANNIVLRSTTNIYKNGLLFYKTSGILLKISGELIKNVDFDNYELSDKDGDWINAMTYLPKTKQIVLINTRKQSATKIYNMEILATNNKGSFDLLKTVTIDDTGSMGIYDVTAIGDSSLLCRYKYVDPTSRNEFNAAVKWSIWAMFPMASLGFTTANKEVIIDNKVRYYPNPTLDLLYIDSKEEFDQIRVYSIEGKLILQKNNSNNSMDTETLHSGMYFFELWKDNKVISNKLKFIKME
jgi:hypothetical protein